MLSAESRVPWTGRRRSLGISPRSGRRRIRTFEGVRQQIYSLSPLATWVFARGKGGTVAAATGGVHFAAAAGRSQAGIGKHGQAASGTRTHNLQITNQVLCQLSYGGDEATVRLRIEVIKARGRTRERSARGGSPRRRA